jgi:uncharacterized protein (TIGR00251 family)
MPQIDAPPRFVAPLNSQHVPVIRVKVRPNARSSSLEEQEDGTFIASLKAPPVDGKANAELVALVARQFDVSRAAVTIKAGAATRLKLVSVAVK